MYRGTVQKKCFRRELTCQRAKIPQSFACLRKLSTKRIYCERCGDVYLQFLQEDWWQWNIPSKRSPASEDTWNAKMSSLFCGADEIVCFRCVTHYLLSSHCHKCREAHRQKRGGARQVQPKDGDRFVQTWFWLTIRFNFCFKLTKKSSKMFPKCVQNGPKTVPSRVQTAFGVHLGVGNASKTVSPTSTPALLEPKLIQNWSKNRPKIEKIPIPKPTLNSIPFFDRILINSEAKMKSNFDQI